MERRVRLSGAVDAKDFRGCRCNEIGNGNYAWIDRQPQNVRIRTDLIDQRPTATGIQSYGGPGLRLPTNNLQRTSAIATMTETEIAARAINPSSGGTKQCTKVPVVGHSCTNSHSPELRDCNRSSVQLTALGVYIVFGLGIQEILIFLFILGMLAVPVMIVIAIVLYVQRSQNRIAPGDAILHRCPDCGGNVSKLASNCPHCGRPMAA